MELEKVIAHLDIEKWEKTDLKSRISLLDNVLENIELYKDELALSDIKAKGWDEKNILTRASGYVSTVVPMAAQINATIDFYKSLVNGYPLKAKEVISIKDDQHDLLVFPNLLKDKALFIDREDYLRVSGIPIQTNPMSRKGGVVAILGAGNYSSALEIIKAMFLKNCVVAHKPHPINEETDKVWAKIFKPLIDHNALTFIPANLGVELTQNKDIDKIFFTGGTETAKKIMEGSKATLISECGGNNPIIIVPSERKWNEKELLHLAMSIVTINKLNGGAVCGRVQTLITSKYWEQREEFLNLIKHIISDDTPPVQSYYPNSQKVLKRFMEEYPNGDLIRNINNIKSSEFFFIEDIDVDSYGVKNEAFTQIMCEVALDVEVDTEIFLHKAVRFANEKLLGTLSSCIIIDDETLERKRKFVEDAIDELEYGTIGINTMPPIIFANPYLIWGGYEEREKENFVSGIGNFGNLLCYENVEKAISFSRFVSPGALKISDEEKGANFYMATTNFYLNPSLKNIILLIIASLKNN